MAATDLMITRGISAEPVQLRQNKNSVFPCMQRMQAAIVAKRARNSVTRDYWHRTKTVNNFRFWLSADNEFNTIFNKIFIHKVYLVK